ncbi:recombinase family protein [Polycladomyces abyssicola]|nr:recombinase family protein [Polycladomyces abyssicola]
MPDGVAELEREIIRERTQAGLAAARARGKLGGRPRVMDERKVKMAQSLL